MNIYHSLKIVFLAGFLFLSLRGFTQGQRNKALPVAGINSEYDELMPVIAPDGKTLYFVRTGHPENLGGKMAGQDIWYSRKDPQKNDWQAARNAGTPLNNIYNNAINSLSPDGQRVWLNNIYLARNRMAPGLSYATKTGNGLSKPEAINIRNFAPETGFLNFYVATDSILFLSMQTDSTQLEDIFICRRVGEKEWTTPERVDNHINTTGFEIAPFLAPDRITLYFTSNGHGGLGDADIFMSRRLDNTWLNWSEPVNLGKEVNTAGFDGYFTLDNSSAIAYFTRENKAKGDTDIYSIRLEDILPSENISADTLNATAPLLKTKQEAGATEAPSVLPVTVFFEINSAQLNPASRAVLQRFREGLKSNDKILVIKGHADDTGTEASNKILSEKRAQAVAAYFKSVGISDNILRIKGYGSSQPAAPNQSAENRAKNRRAEIQVE
jgi:outer membrane protein OmpA-like peptidoglycan-associated protein